MSRCDLEKKKLFDLIQFMAYHSREMLVEIFKECYHDHRDIKRVPDMITRKSGVTVHRIRLLPQHRVILVLKGSHMHDMFTFSVPKCLVLNQNPNTVNGYNLVWLNSLEEP